MAHIVIVFESRSQFLRCHHVNTIETTQTEATSHFMFGLVPLTSQNATVNHYT